MAAPPQESEGHINTSFLTTKLPPWAGVRQNVIGSDLSGRPVPAYNPPEEVKAAVVVGAERAAQAVVPAASIPVVEHAAAIADAIEDLKASLHRCSARVGTCEARIGANVTDIEMLRDVTLAAFEDGMKNMANKVNQLVKKCADISERLAALEEVVEDMEAEDEEDDKPPRGRGDADPIETNEVQ